MAGYGGHEDYDDVLGRLGQAEDAVDSLIAKEERYRGELAETSKVDDKAAEASERRRRSQQETVEVKRRAKAVESVEVTDVNRSTDAIERNARARERLNVAITNSSRAVKGAGDPMFARAYQMHQEGRGTQYAFRKELPQVGSRRAAGIQEAIAAGYRPAGPRATDRPLTRVSAAERGMVAADADLVAAKKTYTNALRRKTATEDERQTAFEERDAAKKKQQAAKLELESARAEAAARSENAAAARAEAAQRERMTAQAVAQSKISGPIPGQLALPAAGQTAQMTSVPRPRLFRAGQVVTPGDPRIMEVGGAGRYGGGSDIRDKAVDAQSTARAVEAEAAASKKAAEAEEQMRANRIGDYYKQAAVAAQSETRALTAQGAAFGTTSQAMYRHGALTSEFIAAAARGETTLKELGNQAVITAGKFGGWTAAATALYGAAAAIGQVGKGALDANDGVQQLTRVIDNVPQGGQAEGALADLAKEFNVPIDVAGDAVYRMGQRFHNFDDAVQAARASLYSFKTGEVDVETSTRQLLSVVSGFGQSSSELAARYDQINEAQNVFGVRIGETEAGMAKAAGAFANAGGDFDHLLGLIVAINRATGVTGTEVGTAISRAVTQIKVPKHITTMRELGVDVDPSDLQATILDAMRVVREAPKTKRPEMANVLAAQIFGNQYARQLAPVLANQQTFNDAMRDTAPEKAKGSAQRELAKVLDEVREQIDSLAIGLQVLGQRLAEAGAFAPLVGVLKLLDSALDLVNGLVAAFNEIPQPLRQTLMLLGQGYIMLQAMRRLGVTDKLLGGPLSSIAAPERRLQIFGARGLRDARDEMFNDVERSGRTVHQRQLASTLATREAAAYAPNVQRAMAMEAGSQARLDILARAEVLEANQLAASDKVVKAERELLEKKKLAYGIERQLATVTSLRPGQVAAYMRQEQIPIPRELAAPNMRGVTFIGQVNKANQELAEQVDKELRSAQAAGAMGGGGGTTGDRLRTSMQRQSGRMETMVRSGMVNVAMGYGMMRDSMANKIGRETSNVGRSARLLERGAARGAGLAVAAAKSLDGVAQSLKRGPGALKALMSSFGILDIALIAYLGMELLGDVLKKAGDREEQVTRMIEKEASTVSKEAERLKRLREVAKGAEGPGTLDEVLRGVGELANPKNIKGAITGDYKSPVERRREQARQAEEELDRQIERQQIANKARLENKPVPFQYSRDLIKTINADAKLREAGIISQAEFDRRMADHAIEAGKMVDGNRKNVQRVRTAIAEAQRKQGGASYAESLRGLDAAGLQTEMQATGALVSMRGLGGGNMERMKQQYEEAQRRWGDKNSAKALTNLANARQSYYQTLIGEVNAELQSALLGARSESERRAAFARAQQRYRDAAGKVREQGRKDRDDTRELREARQKYTGPQPDINAPKLGPTPPASLNQLQGTHPFAGDTTISNEERENRYLQVVIDRYKKQGNERMVKRLEKLRDTENEKLGIVGRVQKTGGALFGAALLGRDKGPNEDLLGEADKLGPDIPDRIKNQRRRGDKIRERVQKKDRELTDAERELQVASYEDRAQGRQIKMDLEISETRDPSEQAAIRVRNARVQVRDAQREFGNKSRQYRQALTELNNARQQQADQIVADVEADNALLLARAGSDPAAQARAAVTAAQRTLAAMKKAGADPNQIKQQQAEVINAQNQRDEQARSEQEQVAGLLAQIATARAKGDPVAAARAAQAAARAATARARTRPERLQALLDTINANNDMENALREREAARFDLLSSRTEDPVEQAQLGVRAARRALRGTTGVERTRRRADLNRARQTYRGSRIDARLDTINFNLEMDKISNEEAAKQIEDLARMKGISKQRKRELLLQAKRLREEASGEYELDLGNIKMPTLYEVRRFVQGGMPSGSSVVTDSRTFNVTITSADAAREFAGVLERTNGTAAKATARSMGAR